MDDVELLFQALKEAGGVANNRTTRQSLEWEWEQYFAARDALIDEGRARSQRGGPGGSTALIFDDNIQSDNETENTDVEQYDMVEAAIPFANESDLYDPILHQLKSKWAAYERYDAVLACCTASQGRRETGGKWTRPDISVIATKRFKFLPSQHFEVVTFEVKPKSQMGVEGVFEALSHRHSVHRSYLLIHATMDEFEATREADRVSQLLQRHQVGLFLAEDPADFETWVEYVAAPRWEPDPFHVNSFIQNVMPSKEHDKVIKMLK